MPAATTAVKPWLVIQTYLKILRPYRNILLIAFSLFLIGRFLEVGLLKLQYKRLIDTLTLSNPELYWNNIVQIIYIIGASKIIISLLGVIGDYTLASVRTKENKKLADHCFSVLQNHSYDFFANNFAGSLVAKVKRFVASYSRIADRFLFNVLLTGTELLTILVVLLIIAWPIGLFFLLWCCLYIGATLWYAVYKLPYDSIAASKDSLVTGKISDVLTNIITVKVSAAKKMEQADFSHATQAEADARLVTMRMDNFFRFIQAIATSSLEVGGLLLSLLLWQRGFITIGTIVLAQTYFISLLWSLWELRRGLSEIYTGFSDASEMVEILTLQPEVQDPITPKKLIIRFGSVVFNQVNFAYDGKKMLLNNFTLHIPAGQHVGIVGASGAGKTTLFKLLLRFVDIQQGTITIDNQNIADSLQDDVRKCFGYVSQEPALFHRTLRENIAYGTKATTDTEVIAAAKKAHAHEFIQKLPLGYNTLVGERGIKLSGGERQRVALARTILQDAPILLLDEATSALDSSSEKYIQENLHTVMSGKTALVIAYRISTIQQLDRIIVLDNGCIIEDGTHAELLRNNGKYAELWNHQTDGFIV